MFRYIIESPHNPEDCDKVIQEFSAAGYLHQFEWGCHDGVHSGWAILETDSLEHAQQIVPWIVRERARIVKLEKFEVAAPDHPSKKK